MIANMTLNSFRIIFVSIAIIAVSALSSCDDDEGKGILPMEFKSADYNIRTNIATLITFEHGSGKFDVNVSNPEVIGYPYVNNIGHHVYVCPVSTGNSTLVVKDLVTREEKTLELTVSELYFEFIVSKISEDIPNPGIEEGDELRFIQTADKKRILEIRRNDEVIKSGLFDVKYGREFRMEFYMWDDPDHLPSAEPDHTYSYLMDSSTLSVYILFYKGFGFQWDGFIDSRGADHPGPIVLYLMDSETKRKIVAESNLQLTL